MQRQLPRFFPKQIKLLRDSLSGNLPRITILGGSVRSGKTHVSLWAAPIVIGTQPIDYKYLMFGKTINTLKNNCLTALDDITFGSFEYNLTTKSSYFDGHIGRLEGAADARSEGKLRGDTLGFSLGDEVTLCEEEFFAMLLSRLSRRNAKLIVTTNPDNPTHWLKKNYIDRAGEIDLEYRHFSIEDNIFLPEDYVDNIKKEYTGVFYDRFIRGLWVAAEGAIYRIFSDNRERYFTDKPEFGFINVGVDFGGNNSDHAFCATGIAHDYSKIVVLRTEKHKATNTSPAELYKMFGKFAEAVTQRYGAINRVYCDSAEQVLINGLRAAYPQYSFANSIKNDVVDRVRCATGLMSSGRFSLTPDCETLDRALCDALWDSKKLDDTRLDDGTTDIDTLDAFEYSFEQYLRQLARHSKDMS